MILVTVGTQGPFDRLVRTVDAWAQENPGHEIFAQIGPSEYQPQAMEFSEGLDPVRFEALLRDADIIIAHAGMGTILKALELGKPVLIMPRRASLGEQRNEHQLATADRFRKMGVVQVAQDESELTQKLGQLFESGAELSAGTKISPSASPELIQCLRHFLGDQLGPPS